MIRCVIIQIDGNEKEDESAQLLLLITNVDNSIGRVSYMAVYFESALCVLNSTYR